MARDLVNMLLGAMTHTFAQQGWNPSLTSLLEETDPKAAAWMPAPGARGWVPLHAVAGLVEHDSWHAGQIAYLRSLRSRTFPNQTVGAAAIGRR